MNERTSTERQAFVRSLESLSDSEIHEQLRKEGTDELCAMNGIASGRLRSLIQREIRNTDDP